MTQREILNEIDLTLDQLIKNGAAFQEVKNDPSCEAEMEALHKTQESLLAHLLHLDQCLKKHPKGKVGRSIDAKRSIFSELSKPTSHRHQKNFLKISN